LLEVPEILGSELATFPRRNTESTGNTKEYGLGLEEGEEMPLVCERDFTNAQQDALRTARANKTPINLQFVITDGGSPEVTETSTASFLVISHPVSTADPNGDGENTKQTFNVKRNSDWVTAES
jgi:hypothetical protein